MGAEWKKDLRYQDDSLVTDVALTHEGLGLTLRCHDAVDIQLDVYVRRIEITDLSGDAREVRLFFSHDFHLYGHEIGDTAYFDPRTESIIHYKVNRYFLANCCADDKRVADYFSCGVKDAPGRRPSWKDAEDGELVESPIAWGLAESTVGVRLSLPARGTRTAFHWLAAGKRYEDVATLGRSVAEHTPSVLIERTSEYWRAWVQKEVRDLGDMPAAVADVFNRSLLILRSQIDDRGAIIAANDSDIVRFGGDTYSYMWGRDGAFVAAALEKSGYPELCRRFFDFCSRVVTEEGYLFQHYTRTGRWPATGMRGCWTAKRCSRSRRTPPRCSSGPFGSTTTARKTSSSSVRCTRSSSSDVPTSWSRIGIPRPCCLGPPTICGRSATACTRTRWRRSSRAFAGPRISRGCFEILPGPSCTTPSRMT